MKLSQSTRKRMQQRIQIMLDKLEMLCQTEYTRIEHCQKEIEASQSRLSNLEAEYLRCSEILKAFKFKHG